MYLFILFTDSFVRYDVYTVGLEQLYAAKLTPTTITIEPNAEKGKEHEYIENNNTSHNNGERDLNKQKLASLFAQAHSRTAKEGKPGEKGEGDGGVQMITIVNRFTAKTAQRAFAAVSHSPRGRFYSARHSC